MGRPGAKKKIAERYRPSIFERLKQSFSARSKKKEEPAVHMDMLVTEPPNRGTPTGGTVTFANSNEVWQEWTTAATYGNGIYGTTSGITSNVWSVWATNTPTTAATDTWIRWQTLDGRAGVIRSPGGLSITGHYAECERQLERYKVEESEEQKKARADQEAKWRAEEVERQRKYQEEAQRQLEANKRAMSLLHSCMTPEQRECLKTYKYFIVVAKSGRRYRIDEGTHGNVRVIDKNGSILERLCIQPNGVPLGDSMLAQKLLIETAEDVFRQHANITLADGKVIHGVGTLLDSDKLANVLPFRRAA